MPARPPRSRKPGDQLIGVDTAPPILWPDRKTGPWKLTAHIDVSTGMPRCVGFDIRSFTERHVVDDGKVVTRRSAGPSGGVTELTASELRRVPFGKVVTIATLILPELMAMVAQEKPDFADAMAERRQVYAQRARRYGLDHYRRVAKIYTKAKGVNPTQAVADELGLSRSAAAKQVSRCRNELGLLPPTRQGRSSTGAAPSPRKGKK